MNFARLIKEALGNLFVAKLRSILTLLGVLIGTASVVALVSSGQLATQHALSQFKTLGTDLLSVTINPASQSGPASGQQQTRLSLDTVLPLQNISSQIIDMAPYSTYYGALSFGGNEIQGGVLGATAHLKNIIKIELAEGRFITVFDKYAFYAVVGNNIAQKMREQGEFDPIGKQIRVGNYIYTIVGVIKPWPENIFMFSDIDDSVIVPIENSFLLSQYVQIQNIIFKIAPNADIDVIQSEVAHNLNAIAPNQQLYFRSAKQLIASMAKQRQTLTLLLSFIGGISLVVGGIGVMNIMLVSVVERRREIGIRLAVGATGKDIGWMFITEAIVLTVVGGILGIIIGVLVSYIAAKFSGWEFTFYIEPPLVGFLVSTMVGVISGFYPAYKASQLDPIATLRSE